jgi:predicted RND superfamily exporter protein
MTRKVRLSLWLLLVLLVAPGLTRIHFDVEVLNLLPPDSPVVQGLKFYQQNFANARELMITLSASGPETAEAAARKLADTLRERTDLVSDVTWEPPWIEHPGQSAEFLAFLWLNQRPAEFASLTNRLSPSNLSQTLSEARERLTTSLSPNELASAGYDPLGLMHLPDSATSDASAFSSGQEFFASADGKFRIVFVEAARDLSSYRECRTWLNQIKGVVQSIRASSDWPRGIIVNYTGRPAFVAEIAGGMERDIAGPSAGTLAVIALLFYISHRRWRPLLWLLVLLLAILAGTLALGGLIYGTLNVVSLGFASILLGLGEDFGIVLYQESRTHPELSHREIRRLGAPGIFWSAVTTAGAFLLLNLSGVPGLGQLGTLVALGVTVAAIVMLFAYLPPLMKERSRRREEADETQPGKTPPAHVGGHGSQLSSRIIWGVTLVLSIGGTFLLWKVPPRFDRSPDALRPKNSESYVALNEIKLRLKRPEEPLWIVIEGKDESEVSRKLAAVEPELRRAVSNQFVASYTLPIALWPQPEHQATNRDAALALVKRREILRNAALAAGFTTNAFAFADAVLDVWQRAGANTNVFWPTNQNSRWILENVAARGADEFLAIGLIHLPPGGARKGFRDLMALGTELQRSGVWLSGWELLGASLTTMVLGELYRVLLPILALVLVSLWLAFRNLREVLLSLATLVFSGLLLHLVMGLAGWSWNMMNLMALPLLLGMGVDFGIHMQLALRRHAGDSSFVRRSIGRALLLAGSTTVAGFASLSFASNAGIAALGRVCAVGIVCAMLTAVYLLPIWWQAFLWRQPSSGCR